MNKTDKNGYQLSIDDNVICDEVEQGRVIGFEGLGVLVRMDSDGAEIDWNNDQVEYTV